MGNYASCALKGGQAARVVTPSGEIRELRQPTKAAHLMLDFPNFFLVNSLSLHIGRRFSALSADEDLDFGNLYLMFPFHRLSSLVTTPDVAFLFLRSKRHSPLLQSNHSDADDDAADALQMMIMINYRTSDCGSRKPLLDTIHEESVSSF